MIMMLFIDLGLFFCDGVFVTEIFDFEAIDFGLHFDHFDGIFLDPN